MVEESGKQTESCLHTNFLWFKKYSTLQHVFLNQTVAAAIYKYWGLAQGILLSEAKDILWTETQLDLQLMLTAMLAAEQCLPLCLKLGDYFREYRAGWVEHSSVLQQRRMGDEDSKGLVGHLPRLPHSICHVRWLPHSAKHEGQFRKWTSLTVGCPIHFSGGDRHTQGIYIDYVR